MPMHVLHKLAAIVAKLPKSGVWAAIFVATALVGLTDYITGVELSFSVFYLVPISMATLMLGQPYGLVFSFLSATAWFTADLVQNSDYSHPLIPFWNATVRLIYFMLHTMLLSSLFGTLQHEREQATHDPLTNAANWRGLKKAGTEGLRQARAARQSVTIAYIDLDNFKSVNDSHGHDIGDLALRTIVESIRQTVRTTDLVARVGGDEIVILLFNTNYENSNRSLDRINARMAEEMQKNDWPITFSVGAITYISPPGELESLVKEADHLMYAVKNGGKNNMRHERRDEA